MLFHAKKFFNGVRFKGREPGPCRIVAPFRIIDAVGKLHSLKPEAVLGKPAFCDGVQKRKLIFFRKADEESGTALLFREMKLRRQTTNCRLSCLLPGVVHDIERLFKTELVLYFTEPKGVMDRHAVAHVYNMCRPLFHRYCFHCFFIHGKPPSWRISFLLL